MFSRIRSCVEIFVTISYVVVFITLKIKIFFPDISFCMFTNKYTFKDSFLVQESHGFRCPEFYFPLEDLKGLCGCSAMKESWRYSSHVALF